MSSKSLGILLTVIVCILLFPITMAIFGGLFGLLFGLIGGIFGIITGMFGAIFGIVGWFFDFAFAPNCFGLIAIAILAVLILRKRPARNA